MSTVNQQKIVAHYPAIVGKVLAQLRKPLGLDQTTVAARLGLSQSAYSRIESGSTAMTVTQLAVAAKALNRRPGEILQFADQAAEQFRRRGVQVVDQPASNGTEVAFALGAAAIAAIVLAAIASE